MKYYLFISLFIVSSFVHSKVYTFDQNNDGRADSIILYTGGVLTSHKIDYNYDGHFDFLQKYSSDGALLFVDSINLRSKVKSRRVVDIIQSNSDKAACLEGRELTLNFFDEFTSDMQRISSESLNSFTRIGSSIKVHKTCYQKFSKKKRIDQYFLDSLKEGVQCLSTLSQQNITSPKRLKVFDLLDRFKAHLSNPSALMSIACGDDSLVSEAALGVASVGATAKGGRYNLEHPFIVLNGKYKSSFWNDISFNERGVSEEKFKGVIFHEMIHNMGYGHGDDIELAYACEACCFGDKSSNSCRVCTGDYDNVLDANHLFDLSLISQGSGSLALFNIIDDNYEKFDWHEEKALLSIVNALELDNRTLSAQFYELVKGRISDPALKKKYDVQQAKNLNSRSEIKRFNKHLANAYYALYILKNERLAHTHLSQLNVNDVRGSSGTFGGGYNRDSLSSKMSARSLARSFTNKVKSQKLKVFLDSILTNL